MVLSLLLFVLRESFVWLNPSRGLFSVGLIAGVEESQDLRERRRVPRQDDHFGCPVYSPFMLTCYPDLSPRNRGKISSPHVEASCRWIDGMIFDAFQKRTWLAEDIVLWALLQTSSPFEPQFITISCGGRLYKKLRISFTFNFFLFSIHTLLHFYVGLGLV